MSATAPHVDRLRRAVRRLAVGAVVAAVAFAPACGNDTRDGQTFPAVRAWTIHYTAHNGRDRLAYVVLPAWYGPGRNPALPVVISPHGRNGSGRSNIAYFGTTPARGPFALISPDGMGRKLRVNSYGYRGQIDDLAKMPRFAVAALPWLRLDRSRVYALGSSMGGQETLLLAARHPRLLAGAAAMDSVTNLSRRYAQLPSVPCDDDCLARWRKPYGAVLQAKMRREVGGTPHDAPHAYAERSALAQALRIASSGVPLQIWWSTRDRIVKDQAHQSGSLYRALRRIDPCAPVSAYIGHWAHSSEMRSAALLPVALREFGLLGSSKALPRDVRFEAPRACSVENAEVAGERVYEST